MDVIVRFDGREWAVSLQREGDEYRVRVDEQDFEVQSVRANGVVRSLLIGGQQHEVAVHSEGDGHYRVHSRDGLDRLEVLDPLTHLARQAGDRRAAAGPERITAYMPGRVTEVLVQEGATVEAGQGVVVLEAMKMENEIEVERAGVVRRLFVAPGQAVEGGDPLFELE